MHKKYLKEKRYEACINCIEYKLNSGQAVSVLELVDLARAYKKIDFLSRALISYNQARNLKPYDSIVISEMLEIYFEMQNIDLASSLIKEYFDNVNDRKEHLVKRAIHRFSEKINTDISAVGIKKISFPLADDMINGNDLYHDSFIKVSHFLNSLEPRKRLFTESFNDEILSKIITRTPFSAIRLGDGEGYFLKNNYFIKEKEEISKVWFSRVLSEAEIHEFTEIISDSISNSDFIGIPSFSRIVDDMMPNPEHKTVRSLLSIYEYLSAIDVKDKFIADAFFNHYLYKSMAFAHMLACVDKVVFITCHHEELLSAYVNTIGFTGQLEIIKIPPEAKYANQFGVAIKKDHYPNTYHSILEAIKNMDCNGVLFLVGAGYLGKSYCKVIKENGGMGLDMGSAIDYMAGYSTRRH